MAETAMKELFTKEFWGGVKKIYEDAQKPPPPVAKKDEKAVESPRELNPAPPAE